MVTAFETRGRYIPNENKGNEILIFSSMSHDFSSPRKHSTYR